MLNKKKEDNLKLRSEEVQEILTNPPSWLVRWGITLVFMFTCIILALSFMIKYPDLVTAKVLISTSKPAEKVIAMQTGQIQALFIKNRDTVTINQQLAILKNTANYADVYKLKNVIDSTSFTPDEFRFPFNELKNLKLGEIGPAYINFEKTYTDFQLLKELNPYQHKIIKNKSSLNEVKQRLKNQILQEKLLGKEFKLKEIDFNRTKGLMDKGVISQQEFEQKELEFIQIQKSINSIAITISQMKEAIVNADQVLKTTHISELEDDTRFMKNLMQSYVFLQDAIRNWEYKYVLKSSIDGVVSFQDYWGKYQFVKTGSIVFSILPTNTKNLVGKLVIPSQNTGKVKIGQKVFIKLDNYPYQQYGMLAGVVVNFSISPDSKGNYIVYISLPKGTETSYGKTLEFRQELIGNAEIVTENLSVAERLFYKFREVLSYN